MYSFALDILIRSCQRSSHAHPGVDEVLIKSLSSKPLEPQLQAHPQMGVSFGAAIPVF